MPIIYIDILFLLNFFMNTVILFSASSLLKKQIRVLRLILTSLISSLYSTVMFFPQFSILYSGLFKVLFLILTSLLAFPSKVPRDILKNTLVFLASNLIFGGVVFLLIFATDFGTSVGAVVSNGEIYLDVSFGTLFLSAATATLITAVVSYIQKQNLYKARTVSNLTIHFGGKTVCGKVLCDTGCTISDPITGRPAIIISPSLADKLIPNHFPDGEFRTRYRMLPYSTLDSEKSFLHGFVSDKVLINDREITDVVIGISKNTLTDFDAIMNYELLENNISRKAVNIKNETRNLV